MKKIDRTFQRFILCRLADRYPDSRPSNDLVRSDADWPVFRFNMAYLQGHGLIVTEINRGFNPAIPSMEARITERGLDQLMDDGGLSAILGVVTIKIHEDSLKATVAAQLNRAKAIPDQEKRGYLDKLQDLPAEATKHLALKLVDAGLANWKKSLPLLQSMLG